MELILNCFGFLLSYAKNDDKINHFEKLPIEVMALILSYLLDEDWRNSRLVSKQLYKASQHYSFDPIKEKYKKLMHKNISPGLNPFMFKIGTKKENHGNNYPSYQFHHHYLEEDLFILSKYKYPYLRHW